MTGTSRWAERYFARSGTAPTFVVFASCRGADALAASGYSKVDVMKVMISTAPIEGAGEVTTTSSPGEWTAAYLRAFYGNEEMTRTVKPIVASLLRDRAVTLLEQKVEGETMGVLALFRTPGLMGVYCVGTVPEHRKQGVATSLLAKARRMAESERRGLILQSLASEGATQLYLDNGFEVMYEKLILEKRLK
ncbi:MAG: GNAT family N-acetyltransferase [Thaumarchaeota archaeon]|nr:GNAT family N-acetyltransferase [Nitrososphaerota archaeon]